MFILNGSDMASSVSTALLYSFFFFMRKPNGVPWFASFVIIITLFQSKLVDTSGSVFLLFKRSQVFKSYFCIESLFWSVFYFLRADPVQAEIS